MTQLHVPVTHQQRNSRHSHNPLLLFSFFLCSQLFLLSFFFFSELGSNPFKSAGIEAGAFADLKRVSYIRIADTNITEIPKGTALIHVCK